MTTESSLWIRNVDLKSGTGSARQADEGVTLRAAVRAVVVITEGSPEVARDVRLAVATLALVRLLEPLHLRPTPLNNWLVLLAVDGQNSLEVVRVKVPNSPV